MKEIKIVSLDNRGRLVVPKHIRKSLGFTEDTQLMMLADSESKKITITPVGLDKDQNPLKFKITIKDAPGSLAKIAKAFGDLGISLMYGESAILERDKTAIWTVITPRPDIPFEQLKRKLKSEGNAIEVEIIPL
jgi:bifunctional DNA-binding transcriptional regulator/antitoxin component of YhaV-PrlF toxin-antitoxin module